MLNSNGELNEEYRLIIKECVKEVFAEHRKEFWVDPEQHYLDHIMLKNCSVHQDDMRKNHEFVSTIREGSYLVKKVSLVTLITTFVGAAISFIVYHMRVG